MKRLLSLAIVLLIPVMYLSACSEEGSSGATEICDNGVDDDGDGYMDCDDQDCWNAPVCTGDTEVCDNGVDDDGDGFADCNDTDCATGCTYLEVCDNGTDDDEDGFVDCADQDCFAHQLCNTTAQEVCDNGMDDDGDGSIDCDDRDCVGTAFCIVSEVCDNGTDDDGDGFADCDDSECLADPECQVVLPEDCANGVDDDGDGLVDCEDDECSYLPECGGETCDNWIDDDGDGLADCDDPDCAYHPNCFTCDPVDNTGCPDAGDICYMEFLYGGSDFMCTSPAGTLGAGEFCADSFECEVGMACVGSGPGSLPACTQLCHSGSQNECPSDSYCQSFGGDYGLCR